MPTNLSQAQTLPSTPKVPAHLTASAASDQSIHLQWEPDCPLTGEGRERKFLLTVFESIVQKINRIRDLTY